MQPITPSTAHVPAPAPAPQGNIPQPVRQTAFIAPPAPTTKAETYTVVVNDIPVRELLFALARDAKLNVDVSNDIEGNVTLNAIDQTLPQILDRISKQVDMRYELNGPNLSVLPDTPFLRNYKIDYVNMSRDSTTTVSAATQVTSGGTGNVGSNISGSSSGSNNSTTAVTSTSNNRFWTTLVQNIKDILRETDKVFPDGSTETTTEQNGTESTTGTGTTPAPSNNSSSSAGRTTRSNSQPSIANSPNPATLQNASSTVTRRVTFREAASVIANPETGIIAVRATSRQHEKIQEFLDQVMSSAKRQVMIEATVVEVQLSDQYQQGIDWQRLSTSGKGWNLSQYPQGTSTLPTGATPSGVYTTTLNSGSAIYGAGNAALFLLNYTNADSKWGNITGTISLLESFGKVKVLSSPKLSVLNNQTAMLKVVDNRVYFNFDVQRSLLGTTTTGVPIYDTTYVTNINTVPVGFLMSVTPEINDSDVVTLNVRPTITRILRYVRDPNPALALANVTSYVPEIQTRELESLLKIPDGQVAVMGGLMQDSINENTDAVPGLSKIPLIGNLFTYHNDTSTKSELVIFLRPVVIKDASLTGDFSKAGVVIPGKDFFTNDKASVTPYPPAEKPANKESSAP